MTSHCVFVDELSARIRKIHYQTTKLVQKGGTLPVAICFNSVNVVYKNGSIKILKFDTLQLIP